MTTTTFAVPHSTTYTIFKVEVDGRFSRKELLDSADEISEWLHLHHFNHVVVISHRTGMTKQGFLVDTAEKLYDFTPVDPMQVCERIAAMR